MLNVLKKDINFEYICKRELSLLAVQYVYLF